MSLLQQLVPPRVSPLARHFVRFCHELDPQADDAVLLAAALVTEHNRAGHTCLDLATLAGQPLFPDEQGESLLEAPAHEAWIEQLDKSPLISHPDAPGNALLIRDGHRLYFRRHWREEQHIADVLLARNTSVPCDPQWLRQRLAALFPADNGGADGQRLAAAVALTRRLGIITGGPGTGKTTTVTRILALLLEQKPELRIMLAAPTGKAAARLTESIGQACERDLPGKVADDIVERLRSMEAATLHRLIGWGRDRFEFDADNPLPCDCLLIDETSMVDQTLMHRVLEALPDEARLILLGDREQLASVEAGSVLGDLTGRGTLPACSAERADELQALAGVAPPADTGRRGAGLADCLAELSYSYRFARGGGIGRLARAVRQADRTAIAELLDGEENELGWLETRSDIPPSRLIDEACAWYEPVLAPDNTPDQALARFNAARVLTARADGPWGAPALGEQIEAAFRQRGLISSPPGTPYRGQPVLILHNDRETGLFNGDTGIVWPDEDGLLLAWFDIQGTLQPFSLHQLPDRQPAWTLSVHRSQGSEYDRVLLVLPPAESRVLSRELIYTGITRARAYCVIAGRREVFLEAGKRQQSRDSGLYERIYGIPD